MPIYEYHCKNCGRTFEELVFGDDVPECPSCHSADTEKLISRCCCHYGLNGAKADPVPDTGKTSGGCAGCSGGNCASCGH